MVIYKNSEKHIAINPLKVSQALGGVLAFQGFFRSIPIIHGSQGCAAFTKALMTRHFREPIAVQTSALQEMDVIFGSNQCMIEAVNNVIAKHDPSIVGVLSTALTETAGEDLVGNIKEYNKTRSDGRFIVPVSLPDFKGSLESGYCKTVENIVEEILSNMKDKLPIYKVKNRVNLFPASHLTPGDVMEIKNILQSFGFEVITIPDISTSLTGPHIKGFSPLSQGGISIDQLTLMMLTAELSIVVGSSMEKVAKKLEDSVQIPYRLFPSLTGLKANDDFFSYLKTISGKPVPFNFRWERDNLIDCMLDGHFYYSGMKVVAALEPDHLYSVIELIKELGGKCSGLVTTMSSTILSNLDEEILIGDLDDLEQMADNVDLWISNSHGIQGAKRKNVPFYALGFPILDRLGSNLVTSVGYRGTTEMLINIGNKLIEERR